jgi:hypothetical protein
MLLRCLNRANHWGPEPGHVIDKLKAADKTPDEPICQHAPHKKLHNFVHNSLVQHASFPAVHHTMAVPFHRVASHLHNCLEESLLPLSEIHLCFHILQGERFREAVSIRKQTEGEPHKNPVHRCEHSRQTLAD